MKKLIGLVALFAIVCLDTAWRSPAFASEANIYNLLRWTGLYGILGVGVAFVIITGGIDLSIGSLVALTAVILAAALNSGMHWVTAIALVLVISVGIGF